MAELAKQDSTVSSLSIPPAFATMLGTYRLEESDKFEEFMQVPGHPVAASNTSSACSLPLGSLLCPSWWSQN